jgi:hypothetical protein
MQPPVTRCVLWLRWTVPTTTDTIDNPRRTDRHLAEHRNLGEYESLAARHMDEHRKLTERMLQDHHKLADRHLAELGELRARHSHECAQ